MAGVFDGDDAQDRNVAYAHLGFLQENAQRGGTGGIVTQFDVEVDDPSRIDAVASAIDEAFAHDQFPTTTRPASAFVARAARDVVALVGFASIVGWASLAAVFALIANAIALAVRDRIRDHSILRTLGWRGGDIAWMVLVEAAMLGAAGGAVGALGAHAAIAFAHLTFAMEGVSIEVVAGAVPAASAARREIAHGFRAA